MQNTQAQSNTDPATLTQQVAQSEWYKGLAKYEKPNLKKAVFQLLNTLVPYFLLWAAMIWMLRAGLSYWLTVPLCVLAAGMQVRIFIFFHDCGHGSFLPSKRANTIMGYICGILTFTPYEDWRLPHAGHHASTGDLDRRGKGDVWTMTVEEFLEAPKFTQIIYRFFRNPIILFVFGPPIMFLAVHRFPHRRSGKRERQSVLITNLALLGLMILSYFTIGLGTFLMIQLPMMTLAGTIGLWLFYVQHQYEGVYWEDHQDWNPISAALDGSSYYKLPKVLQWFSGNIGLHHIHHLRPRIPNYNLQQCYDEIPELQIEEPLTLGRSLTCWKLNLWDDEKKALVTFRAIKPHLKQMKRMKQAKSQA
jgi:omega-6 fatty acid desaturase (delta-12 desaturase)